MCSQPTFSGILLKVSCKDFEKVLAHWHVGQVRRTADWKGGFKRDHANKETKGAGLKVQKGRMIDDRNVAVQGGLIQKT